MEPRNVFPLFNRITKSIWNEERFTLSVSGVKADEFVSDNGGNWDTNWNPIWYVKTRVDILGWTAEVKIPFSQLRYGNRNRINFGVDGKLAITRDLILDYTINPDFGQVEADPGAVRLDGYEVFFEERRPFFIESRNLFDYQLTGSFAGGNYDSDLLFYSRRIGGAPHGYPNLADGEYADIPQKTSKY